MDELVVLLGYNTNGFAHHRLEDAITILAEIGYRSVAITLERDLLDPPDRRGVPQAVGRLRRILKPTDLRVTIETGSRFILDPRRKHQPTLVSALPADRRRRCEFILAAIEIAAAVRADSVSLWSGAPDDLAGDEELHARLTRSLREVLTAAEASGMRLGFEPEPGMFIDTLARFAQLHDEVSHPLLGLTLDVGHVHCVNDGEVRDHIRRWRHKLWNVHLEDMRRGLHEHLLFGEGEIEFAPLFDVLREIEYPGPVHVELSRHSHDAVETARRSFEFLQLFA